ncbi:CopG family transcriptional regulator [Microbacterium sp. W4I4]|uniref:CopG family transcriptional regulator n=1 Tax=Microbacterium sp. W4I4 TaxID=3042295 RepID=UPI0027D7888B|nr:CopG family transcriptional regulator [Microbacterium sp. W4I4]
MRTTLNLSDVLARAAKSRAAAEGRTFTSYLEEALREHLAREVPDDAPTPLPTYVPKNPGSLIDLDDRDAVWDALDKSA